MRNNKLALSLVVASMAAMASVPDLLKQNNNESSEKNIIDIKENKPQKTEAQINLSENINQQMTAIWTKKTPATKIGETVDVLVNNYGEKDQSIKEKIYKELKLAANDQDSTSLAPGTYTNPLTHAQTTGAVMHMSCHAACHSACHSACHGSRGWRKK